MARHVPLKKIEEFRLPGGWDDLVVWREDDGWRQRGPAPYGPKAVRTSGRGPSWTGVVDEAHVKSLLYRIRRNPEAVKILRITLRE